MAAPTASDLVDAFHRGERSPVDVIQNCLALIDAHDSEIKAWVEVDRGRALLDARARYDAMKSGAVGGSLLGVPVGIKDIIDVAGLPTRAGAAHFAHRHPDSDAAVVAALRRAGAIVLGKTHTTQFAYIDPAPTRNPWNPAHTPGGSSAGSAAAVAAGMATIAIGSQTVGSVLRPAAYCGVVGFKPSYGRTSTEGVIPLARTLDHVGIFARSVADVWLVLKAVAEPAAGSATASGLGPLPQQLPDPGAAPSLGLLRDFYTERTRPEIVDHLDALVKALGAAGAWVEQVALPFTAVRVSETSNTILRFEAAHYHEPAFREHASEYSPNLRALIESGLKTSLDEYQAALARRDGFRNAVAPLAANFDALMLPTAPSAAPEGLSSTGDPIFCALASTTGLPSISLPSGLNDAGLPLAFQLIGRPGGEGELLATAAWV